MRSRILYAKADQLTQACRGEIERALRKYRPLDGSGRAVWEGNLAQLYHSFNIILAAIPKEWGWSQSPIPSQAKPILRRFQNILKEVQIEKGLLQVLEKSYFASYRFPGNGSHESHLVAPAGRHIQFAELLWRIQQGVEAYLATASSVNGRRGYDEGLLWLVKSLFDCTAGLFPKAKKEKGNKGALPTIIRAVLDHQITYEDGRCNKSGKVKISGRTWDIVNAARSRRMADEFTGRPPSAWNTTTTTTTAI